MLKAVITITTDLGETFYPENIDLVATIRQTEDEGEVYLRRKLQWPASARSLPISFDLSRSDVEWPACMHVAVKAPQPVRSLGFMSPIVDVWSSTLNPTKGHFEASRRVERRFVSSTEQTLSLLEDAGDSIARHLWDGSQALAHHIDQTISLQLPSELSLLEYVLVSATYRRLRVLELGCGCGTVGISLAQAVPDCKVILTDLPEVTELVNANIERMKPAMASSVAFEPLDWEQPLPETVLARTTDLVIVSECTYNTDTLQPLVATLSALTVRSPRAVIVVSTKTRHSSEAVFFDMMKEAGFTQDSTMRCSLPGLPGDGYADRATDVGLHVFHGSKHRLSMSPRVRSEEDVPQKSCSSSSSKRVSFR